MRSKAQQEMVGFVLIVLIVMIAMFIFLVLSLRGHDEPTNSLEVQNMLDSIFKMTTDCAPVFEPQYNDFEALFKTCYAGARCKNLDEPACAYLNETLTDILEQLAKTKLVINAYSLDFYSDEEGLLRISSGNCTGNELSALKTISKDSQMLHVKLKICEDAF
jgi:hypothetical protein